MKYISVLAAFIVFISFPGASHALSCIDPEGMVKHYAEEPDYIVVTAKPTEQVEHVKEKATMEGTYDSGYTAQFLDISKAHKGTIPEEQWVYFHRDWTWNYLCAGEPPKIGSENLYIINVSSNLFEPPTVVGVHPINSDIAKDTLEAIEDAEEIVEPGTYEVSKADWVQRLHDELKDMAFLVRVKLAEWKFWSAK